MTEARRHQLLYVTLAVAVGWSGWLALTDTSEDDTIELAEPAPRAPVASPTPRAAAGATVAVTNAVPPREPGSRLTLSERNLFPRQTWYVPPPPPPPPPPAPYVPPPPPQAPPLPYAYMGQWQEGNVTTFYLVRGTMPLSVRQGQVVDGVWRLDSAAAGTLVFTYLPLNQTRTLRTDN